MRREDKEQKGIIRRLSKKGLLITNISFIIPLLLSYLAAYVSPEHFWWMELFALAYGTLLSINLFFIVLWLILGKKYFLYSLIAVIIGFSRLFGILQFRFGDHVIASPGSSTGHKQLKVMSYNVHLFDLYDWVNNFRVRSKMFGLLKEESPDIACFQEFFSSTRKDLKADNADTLRKVLSAPYSHIEYTLTLHVVDNWGLATYSKYPIINQKAVPFTKPGGNIFMYSDIVAGPDTFRVFNFHLESDKFQPADYRFVENFDIGKNEPSPVQGILKRVTSIVKRLKESAIKRSQELPLLEQYISESPYAVIVCGDFNDTPSSYVYNRISNGLKDGFRESGSGFGKTYRGGFPSFRIDYILHDKKIKSSSFHTGDEKHSDHYPISCVVQCK